MEEIKTSSYTLRTTCRLCGSSDIFSLIHLGNQPLADKFVTDLSAKEETYPLTVFVCQNCWLVQQMCDVNDEILFGDDYAFYTGASPSSIKYFEDYANDVKRRFPEQANGFVVEIASNDGTLLNHFTDSSKKVLGVEPTANTAQVAIDNNIPTEIQPFNFITAKRISETYGSANIIMANNVFAHVKDPGDFIQGIAKLLHRDGIAIIEFQYLPHLLFNNAFDHIYHEHRSFFSLTPLIKAFEIAGLQIFDCQEADTQGGSLRIFVSHVIPPGERVNSMEYYEVLLGLDKKDTYLSFKSNVQYHRLKLKRLLNKLIDEGKTIAGFGASAKGNTLLNFYQLTSKTIPYIVDRTPYKIGKYAPGSHIPVISEDKNFIWPDYYLLLVWNYKTAILQRESAFREHGGKFIVPIPNVEVI